MSLAGALWRGVTVALIATGSATVGGILAVALSLTLDNAVLLACTLATLGGMTWQGLRDLLARRKEPTVAKITNPRAELVHSDGDQALLMVRIVEGNGYLTLPGSDQEHLFHELHVEINPHGGMPRVAILTHKAEEIAPVA